MKSMIKVQTNNFSLKDDLKNSSFKNKKIVCLTDCNDTEINTITSRDLSFADSKSHF